MSNIKFPSLPLAEWRTTLNTIQSYAQVMGKIRRALTPRQKHWFHVSLRIGVTGVTTTPIPAGASTFEMLLDFTTHKLIISSSKGDLWHRPLTGQSPAVFCEEALAALSGIGITPEIDRSLFSDTTPGPYDRDAIARFWQALIQIDLAFNQFKGELREETSPIQLWPHHFDLAMLWFSGRLVPGIDPTDEENADEQINFGFVPGDETIPDPYFYITAYPLPDGLTDTPLPEDATWLTEGFTGAILMYESLVTADNPREKLLNFLRTVQQAGSGLMK